MNILRISFLSFFIMGIYSCKSSRMGTTKYGKDGVIESGVAKTKCTYPAKRYARGLDVKVKSGIDSLALLPAASFDVGVTQTVTRLSDYSSQGLDVDLILFHLCEISINKGFTADQTNQLFKEAIDAWSKKSSNTQ